MDQKKKMSKAMVFIILFGIVSLFSDMTHEGASSIRGAYFTLLGASAGTIGFVSGLGELVGYSMTQEGVGKSFGIQEVLDQIGAFLGPVLLYVVMLLKTEGTTFQVYSFCFAVLAIPGAITLILLLVTRYKFPNPEKFEPEPKVYIPFKMKKEFIQGVHPVHHGYQPLCLWIYRLLADHNARFKGLYRTRRCTYRDVISAEHRNHSAFVCRSHADRCSVRTGIWLPLR